jgi:hypothetical protein
LMSRAPHLIKVRRIGPQLHIPAARNALSATAINQINAKTPIV